MEQQINEQIYRTETEISEVEEQLEHLEKEENLTVQQQQESLRLGLKACELSKTLRKLQRDLAEWKEQNENRRPEIDNIEVAFLSANGTVINRFALHEKKVPTSLDALWSLLCTGIKDKDRIRTCNGKASVLSSTGRWASLTVIDYPVHRLKKERGCYQYQVTRVYSPKASPSNPDNMKTSSSPRELQETVRTLFARNPFQDHIPERHDDATIEDVKSFFLGEDGDDPKHIATLFAMPGSGKTRTIREAAIVAGAKCLRYRLCEYRGFEQMEAKVVQAIKQHGDDGLLVIHFDEVQVWLDPEWAADNMLEEDDKAEAPKDDDHAKPKKHKGEVDLQKLANSSSTRGNNNQNLKFIFTGTNINANTPIKLGSHLKFEKIATSGSFPKEFVLKLYRDHLLEEPDAELDALFERCRHNRRVTENFLWNLWRNKDQGNGESALQLYYEKARADVSDSITKQIGNTNVACPAACRIFRILCQAMTAGEQPNRADDSNVISIQVVDKDLPYVLGGGLNVRSVGEDKGSNGLRRVEVYVPVGCVFEILSNTMGQAAPFETRNHLLSFLRTSRIKELNIGFLLEALVVYDLQCAGSDIEKLLECGHRHQSIMDKEPVREPKLWDVIPDAAHDDVIWWVKDEANRHQNRWIDVGYRQQDDAIVIMEVKSGVKDEPEKWQKFFKEAISLAKRHREKEWIAVYLSLTEPAGSQAPKSLPTNLKVLETHLPTDSWLAVTVRILKDDNGEEWKKIAQKITGNPVQEETDQQYGGSSQPPPGYTPRKRARGPLGTPTSKRLHY